MRLKSVIARGSKEGGAHKIAGFVLNDGTPLKSVEVKVDNGAWQAATIQAPAGKFAWKYFTYTWTAATPAEHTIVSRATARAGYVQPETLPENKPALQPNPQFPRT